MRSTSTCCQPACEDCVNKLRVEAMALCPARNCFPSLDKEISPGLECKAVNPLHFEGGFYEDIQKYTLV